MLLIMRTRAAAVAAGRQAVKPLLTASGLRIKSPNTPHKWKQQSPSARTATTPPIAKVVKTNEAGEVGAGGKGVGCSGLQLGFTSTPTLAGFSGTGEVTVVLRTSGAINVS